MTRISYPAGIVTGFLLSGRWRKEFAAKGRKKRDVPTGEFRKACRDYAQKWLDIQREEFKRLGGEGDWDNPYTTMAFESEAKIAAELLKFAELGLLYRGSKPVMWSPVEQTALAEAEIEYHDHQSTTIWVKFPVLGTAPLLMQALSSGQRLRGQSLVTAQSAMGRRMSYGLYEVVTMQQTEFEPWSKPGDKLILSDALAESVREAGLMLQKWKCACKRCKLLMRYEGRNVRAPP